MFISTKKIKILSTCEDISMSGEHPTENFGENTTELTYSTFVKHEQL